jgi:hypothetical protein
MLKNRLKGWLEMRNVKLRRIMKAKKSAEVDGNFTSSWK